MAVVLLPLWSISATGNSAAKTDSLTAQQAAAIRFVAHKTQRYAANDCHWRQLAGRRCIRSSGSYTRTRSLAYAKWSLKLWTGRSKRDHAHAKRWMVDRMGRIQSETDRMRRVMGQKVPDRRLAAAQNVEAAFNLARRTAKRVRQEYTNPPEMAAFLCIHRYEGSWTDQNSGGNGHYGGVQFGKNEWLRFGYPYTGKLWAYQADMYAQLWAAHRYYQVSGFSPWPQTARACNLL